MVRIRRLIKISFVFIRKTIPKFFLYEKGKCQMMESLFLLYIFGLNFDP